MKRFKLFDLFIKPFTQSQSYISSYNHIAVEFSYKPVFSALNTLTQ